MTSNLGANPWGTIVPQSNYQQVQYVTSNGTLIQNPLLPQWTTTQENIRSVVDDGPFGDDPIAWIKWRTACIIAKVPWER